MKVSLLPIGAYRPEWFMSPIHVSPEQAISIHQDVKSETSIGMHFGTFPLADDGHDDPANDLRRAMAKQGISPDRFLIPTEGEVMVFERE
jgi:L-ascorbate metabolism protein UlaG (beta-lactamase superfamily)